MAMALLPALAGMASQGQGQQNQAIDQVDPQKNGQDTQQNQMNQAGFQIQPQQDSNQGGNASGILSMLSKLGQNQQNNPHQPSALTTPPPAGNPQNPGQPSTQFNFPGQQVQTSGTQPSSTLGTVANGPANGSDYSQGFGQFLMQLFGSNS